MDNSPKVSILVPVYHVEDYLESALDSILAQTLKDIEVICLDEGEDDACYEILCEFAAKDSRVKIVHKKHGGYGPALSEGLALATGKYVGFVDPDDSILPRMYAELYDYAEYIEADFVKSPWLQKMCDGREEIKKPFYEFPKWRTFNAVDFPQIFALHPSIWAGLYKREFLIRNHITFTDPMFSDQKFRMQTLLGTDKIGWYDKAFYKYTMDRVGSVTLNWNLDAMMKVWLDIHQNLPQNVANAISKFLIVEEYLCIFQAGHLKEITEKLNADMFAKMKMCLAFTSSADIENAPALSFYEKRYLLKLQQTSSIEDLQRLPQGRFYTLRKFFFKMGLSRSHARNILYKIANRL